MRRLVACLCAQWCGACRGYQPLFAEVTGRAAGGLQVLWVDIEDEAEIMGDLDVETFPTLLVADLLPGGPAVRFFGPLPPHAQTLARLLDSLQEEGARLPEPADGVKALARRLAARAS